MPGRASSSGDPLDEGTTSEGEGPHLESGEDDVIDANRPETIPDAEVADNILSESTRRSLRAEALSKEHLLHHNPKPTARLAAMGNEAHTKDEGIVQADYLSLGATFDC